jgi:hypothetical protein
MLTNLHGMLAIPFQARRARAAGASAPPQDKVCAQAHALTLRQMPVTVGHVELHALEASAG